MLASLTYSSHLNCLDLKTQFKNPWAAVDFTYMIALAEPKREMCERVFSKTL